MIPQTAARQASLVHYQLLELTQTHVRRVADVIQPSHSLSSPSSPAPNPSQNQGLFKWVSSLHQVARVLEFQLQHQSFRWNPGLISFRMDWLDLLAVQGTLKSRLQHHSSKASILRRSAFFTIQLSQPYMTKQTQAQKEDWSLRDWCTTRRPFGKGLFWHSSFALWPMQLFTKLWK